MMAGRTLPATEFPKGKFLKLFLLAKRAASHCRQTLQYIADPNHARVLQTFSVNGASQGAQSSHCVTLVGQAGVLADGN